MRKILKSMYQEFKKSLFFTVFLVVGYAFEETPCTVGRALNVQRMLIDRLAFEERWALDAHESAIPQAVLLDSPILLIGVDSFATCSARYRSCWIDGLMDGRLALGTEKREATAGESFERFLLDVEGRLDAKVDNPQLESLQTQTPSASSGNSDFDASGRPITVPFALGRPNTHRKITRCRMDTKASGLKSIQRARSGYAPPDKSFLLALKQYLVSSSNAKADFRLVVPYGSNLLAYSYVLVINGADRKFYKILRFTNRDLRLLGEYAERGNKEKFDRLKIAMELGRAFEQRMLP